MDSEQRLDAILQQLVIHRGVLGVALVSRDGICLRSVGRIEMARERFAAMCAAAMSAAEIALGEVDAGKAQHLIVTTDRLHCVMASATREILFVAMIQLEESPAAFLPHLHAAGARVALAWPPR